MPPAWRPRPPRDCLSGGRRSATRPPGRCERATPRPRDLRPEPGEWSPVPAPALLSPACVVPRSVVGQGPSIPGKDGRPAVGVLPVLEAFGIVPGEMDPRDQGKRAAAGAAAMLVED